MVGSRGIEDNTNLVFFFFGGGGGVVWCRGGGGITPKTGKYQTSSSAWTGGAMSAWPRPSIPSIKDTKCCFLEVFFPEAGLQALGSLQSHVPVVRKFRSFRIRKYKDYFYGRC